MRCVVGSFCFVSSFEARLAFFFFSFSSVSKGKVARGHAWACFFFFFKGSSLGFYLWSESVVTSCDLGYFVRGMAGAEVMMETWQGMESTSPWRWVCRWR